MGLDSAFWQFLEKRIYNFPEPAPRTRAKPLEVICVGPPRSATESLQAGLTTLGYDAHHGWDILFEQPNRSRGWARLCRRKWYGDAPVTPFTTADFDALMGHADAIVDAPASVFAAELIALYPEAKVVLNTRTDMEAWLSSMNESILAVDRDQLLWFLSWFDSNLFWAYRNFLSYMWPGFFRNIDSRIDFTSATHARGKWIYQEHCNMIRGLVPQDRLLEWTAQDGWEPLCKFLGKEVPVGPFPHINTKDKGWKEREAQWTKDLAGPALRKAGTFVVTVFGGLLATGIALYIQ